jgi:hypothetical protein
VGEAFALELEVQRLRDENADLRRRVGEVSALEVSKKKLQTKLDQVEQRVYTMLIINHYDSKSLNNTDGRPHSRESHSEGE